MLIKFPHFHLKNKLLIILVIKKNVSQQKEADPQHSFTQPRLQPGAELEIYLRGASAHGCNSCKKPNLTDFFNPKPKPKSKPHSRSSKTTHSSLSGFETPTSFSPSSDTTSQYWDMHIETDKEVMCSTTTTTVRGFGRVGGESLAVEKESDDPYLDFRYSMLQMILEKEIYSKDDLKELLNCFLKLNSPYYHRIIVTAFTDIWNGLFSIKPGGDSTKLYFGFS